MRRPKVIDERGHDPRPGSVPARIDCFRCKDFRRKDRPWKRPCPGSVKELAIVPISREEYELEAAGWLRPADVPKVKVRR